MKANEQNTSVNITSMRDTVLPNPIGSGNVSDSCPNDIHFSIPWFRNNNPMIIRAHNKSNDDLLGDGASGKRNFSIIVQRFGLIVVCSSLLWY